ncbi:glycosyltransferase involved in cell wall biosynthesis [Pontibacter aydingkolensis]|uniref:Uncharacterized protein n=1 Tax=Pontibacter aydingkolensis TaxID=1911536 RepID=A0ABS7CU56_9BACT|nr:hypothetical protein [Pontibacter aydingkolensis]MBW7467206.1 hypothetical protein [Pontibacter aydingkolensis]
MQSIVLVSSGQPSANPRLVKEAVALNDDGYNVTVIYVPISPWADEFDEELFRTHPTIKFIQAGYHIESQRWSYKWSRFRRKLLVALYKITGDKFNIADYSTALFGQELLKEAIKQKADLYVAHNLAALPAAVKAARLNAAKVGFDAEDFHREEFNSSGVEKTLTIQIENKYFPHLDYLSVASPLIGKAYAEIFPELNPLIINNVFSAKVNPPIASNGSSTLRLFWFSQSIGRGRGIETIIKAMGILNDVSISLTLLGNISAEMKSYLLKIADEAAAPSSYITFNPPVAEAEIFKIASQHDIGVGGEIPSCLNREFCLTNKIFTYLLAGNALVLSDTQAQKKFLEDYPAVGSIFRSEEPESLAYVLRQYANEPDLLVTHRMNAREIALNELNWEKEKEKFIDKVVSVLSK